MARVGRIKRCEILLTITVLQAFQVVAVEIFGTGQVQFTVKAFVRVLRLVLCYLVWHQFGMNGVPYFTRRYLVAWM